jgi:hypothetical protein
MPLRHPGVLLGLVSLLVGYAGLLFEFLEVAESSNEVFDSFTLLIAAIGLPIITRLFLRLIARPQDFLQPTQTVVGTFDFSKRLRVVSCLGYVIMVVWLSVYLYIGIAKFF